MGKNSAMKPQNQSNIYFAFPWTEKACENLLLLADLQLYQRPEDYDLCSPGPPPTTKTKGKKKALVLPLVTHLGGQNGDCNISCLSRGKLTTGSPP